MRSRARLPAVLALVAVGLAALSLTASGTTPRPASRVPSDEFVRVYGPTVSRTEAPPPIYEPVRKRQWAAAPRRSLQPDVAPRSVPRPPSTPLDAARGTVAPSTGRSVRLARGGATWYCLPGVSVCPYVHSGGLYAAAGPALRHALGSHWRGRVVTACRVDDPGTCVTVRLVDWCACGGGHVIDLFADAFRRLGSLSAGIFTVTVR